MTVRPSTYDAIIEAAFSLFNEDPTATIAEIAEFAGVGRATFHRHFKGRDDLMSAMAHLALRELDHAIELATAEVESHTEGLRLAMAASIPLGNRQWFLATEFVAFDESVKDAYQSGMKVLASEIEAAKSEGSLDLAIPTEWIARVYESLIYAAWESVKEQEATPDQAARLAWRSFINGNGNLQG